MANNVRVGMAGIMVKASVNVQLLRVVVKTEVANTIVRTQALLGVSCQTVSTVTIPESVPVRSYLPVCRIMTIIKCSFRRQFVLYYFLMGV